MAAPFTDAITGLVKSLRRDLATTGTSLAQARILGVLTERGPLRIGDLAALEQVAQPTMSALVTRMQRLGLVTRAGNAEDGRAVVVTLTPDGSRVFDEVSVVRHAAMTRALAKLPPEDLAAIAAALPALRRLHTITEARSS